MDALDLLETQHHEIAALFDRIEAEPSVGHRTGLVARLVRIIDAHTRAEERHLYATLSERIADRTRLYAAYEVHSVTRHTAETLLKTRGSDVRFGARLKILRDLFQQHAHEEEDWLFQAAKREMTDEELDDVGDLVERSYGLLLELAGRQRPSVRRAKRANAPRAARSRARVAPPRHALVRA